MREERSVEGLADTQGGLKPALRVDSRPAGRRALRPLAADEEAPQHRLVQAHLQGFAVLEVHGLGEGRVLLHVLEPVGDLVVGADVLVADKHVRATGHLAAGHGLLVGEVGDQQVLAGWQLGEAEAALIVQDRREHEVLGDALGDPVRHLLALLDRLEPLLELIAHVDQAHPLAALRRVLLLGQHRALVEGGAGDGAGAHQADLGGRLGQALAAGEALAGQAVEHGAARLVQAVVGQAEHVHAADPDLHAGFLGAHGAHGLLEVADGDHQEAAAFGTAGRHQRAAHGRGRQAVLLQFEGDFLRGRRRGDAGPVHQDGGGGGFGGGADEGQLGLVFPGGGEAGDAAFAGRSFGLLQEPGAVGVAGDEAAFVVGAGSACLSAEAEGGGQQGEQCGGQAARRHHGRPMSRCVEL